MFMDVLSAERFSDSLRDGAPRFLPSVTEDIGDVVSRKVHVFLTPMKPTKSSCTNCHLSRHYWSEYKSSMLPSGHEFQFLTSQYLLFSPLHPNPMRKSEETQQTDGARDDEGTLKAWGTKVNR